MSTIRENITNIINRIRKLKLKTIALYSKSIPGTIRQKKKRSQYIFSQN